MSATEGIEAPDVTLEEAVLIAACPAIQQATGLETLPFFSPLPAEKDEREHTTKYRVECEINGSDHWIEARSFEIEVSAAVMVGIALGNQDSVRDFARSFLPIYRAHAMGGLMSLYLVPHRETPEDFGDGERMPGYIEDLWDALTDEWPDDLGDWSIADVDFEPISERVSRLLITCDREPVGSGGIAEQGDRARVAIDVSWRDFEAYPEDAAVRGEFLDRLMHALRACIAEGRLEPAPPARGCFEDEFDDDVEDPFITGELVEDDDGRVHAARDLYR